MAISFSADRPAARLRCFFQKGHVRSNLLLAAMANQIPAYSLIESNARASESARANSASSGFKEMLMVTAFMPAS